MFFNYPKMYSVTAILLVLKLPSFDTVVHNYKYSLYRQWTGSVNSVVHYLSNVDCMYYVCVCSLSFFLLFLSLACFCIVFYFYGPVVPEINYMYVYM